LQHPETRHSVRSAPTSLKKNASPNRCFTIPEGTNRQRPASTSLNGTLPQTAASPSPKERIGNDLLPHPEGKLSQKWSVPAPERTRPDSLDVMNTSFPSNAPAIPEGKAAGSSANRLVQESCGCPSPQTFIPE
jgi:hypothetical protein